MTIKQLAVKLCKKEGKRKQVSIAQVNEILSILSDMIYAQFQKRGWRMDCSAKSAIDACLYQNGKKRAFKKTSRTVK